MNRDHQTLCSSDDWADYLRTELVPWGLDGVRLDGRVLELGGGYGASTAYLTERTTDLTVLEADPELADGLAARFTGATVIWGDATAIPEADAGFDTVLCFTMLHHVDTAAAQDRLFAEAARVLRPGGTFAGTDSVDSDRFRGLHVGDVCEPVDPATMPDRLRAAGFTDARTDRGERAFRFHATR
jgi:SAM-dependent methyltransferase